MISIKSYRHYKKYYQIHISETTMLTGRQAKEVVK